MPVSGIVLSCLEGAADDVAEKAAMFDGVEIHGVLPDSRIIAVVEADTVNGEVARVEQLHEIEGVVSVQLACHYFEDA
jgi:periplasmic nitrate reductase NapD